MNFFTTKGHKGVRRFKGRGRARINAEFLGMKKTLHSSRKVGSVSRGFDYTWRGYNAKHSPLRRLR